MPKNVEIIYTSHPLSYFKGSCPYMSIEKDLWVCWVLEQLFILSVQMVFKESTSLSKVFNNIKRFPEDCDFTIDYQSFTEKN